jgi:hypothetical protein
VLGVVGGALGYLALHPEAGSVQRAAPNVTASSQAAPPSAKGSPMQAAQPAKDTAERTTDEQAGGVQAVLDRWSTAIKHGDADAAAQCYAPQVATYFDLHNADRDQVRRAIRHSLSRYGGLDIYRLSGIKITPVAADRAVVTFRKHWQTSGYRKSAGEEQERLVLVHNQGAWQIASEQEEKIYWTHRPR